MQSQCIASHAAPLSSDAMMERRELEDLHFGFGWQEGRREEGEEEKETEEEESVEGTDFQPLGSERPK